MVDINLVTDIQCWPITTNYITIALSRVSTSNCYVRINFLNETIHIEIIEYFSFDPHIPTKLHSALDGKLEIMGKGAAENGRIKQKKNALKEDAAKHMEISDLFKTGQQSCSLLTLHQAKIH